MKVIIEMTAEEAAEAAKKGTLVELLQHNPKPATKAEKEPEPKDDTLVPKPVMAVPQSNPPAPKAAPAVPVTPAVPTSEQSYTEEQIGRAGAELAGKGMMQECLNLMKEFGISAISELPKNQYNAFAVKLREMGASI